MLTGRRVRASGGQSTGTVAAATVPNSTILLVAAAGLSSKPWSASSSRSSTHSRLLPSSERTTTQATHITYSLHNPSNSSLDISVLSSQPHSLNARQVLVPTQIQYTLPRSRARRITRLRRLGSLWGRSLLRYLPILLITFQRLRVIQ